MFVARRRGERRRAGAARRHAAERHPEGVPGAEGVHLPAAPVVAARARHDHVLHRARCRAGTRSRSPATTSAKRARRPRRSSRSRVANGFAYVELGLQAGLDVDAFAPRLSFFFNAHIDFFEEIAKYRAARRIWARWMRERYGAASERSLQMRFHTQTAGVSLTAQQPEVNIVRTAIEALAGVLGGTQSLHTNSMDETLALPTEKAARHRAAHAAGDRATRRGSPNVADPLGGSWYVEALTDEIERQRRGRCSRASTSSATGSMLDGAVRGVEEGWFQSRDRRLRLRARAQAERRPARRSSA